MWESAGAHHGEAAIDGSLAGQASKHAHSFSGSDVRYAGRDEFRRRAGVPCPLLRGPSRRTQAHRGSASVPVRLTLLLLFSACRTPPALLSVRCIASTAFLPARRRARDCPCSPTQVVQRSGGVVFMEQLAPVLNPREGPPEWYRESATAGGGSGGGGAYGKKKGAGGGISIEAVGGEALVLRLLFELDGAPEVRTMAPRVRPRRLKKGPAVVGRHDL